jgi:hypothetical protein
MKYIYEEVTDDFGNKSIKRIDEGGLVAWIPIDEGNSDYREYLASLKDEASTL